MTAVLDASALLAYLQREAGADSVRAVISNARISTVNWVEVVQKINGEAIEAAQLRSSLEGLGIVFIPLTSTQAEIAGSLRSRTKTHGLSLGDRAYLALGIDLRAPVYTADRVWAQLAIESEVVTIR